MWRLIACSNGAMSLLVVCFVCFLFFQKIVDSHSALYPHSPATVHCTVGGPTRSSRTTTRTLTDRNGPTVCLK